MVLNSLNQNTKKNWNTLIIFLSVFFYVLQLVFLLLRFCVVFLCFVRCALCKSRNEMIPFVLQPFVLVLVEVNGFFYLLFFLFFLVLLLVDNMYSSYVAWWFMLCFMLWCCSYELVSPPTFVLRFTCASPTTITHAAIWRRTLCNLFCDEEVKKKAKTRMRNDGRSGP